MPRANKKTRKQRKSRKNLRKSRKNIQKQKQKGGYVLFRAQVGEPVASDEVKHEWTE